MAAIPHLNGYGTRGSFGDSLAFRALALFPKIAG
jgi:hypothetical protein